MSNADPIQAAINEAQAAAGAAVADQAPQVPATQTAGVPAQAPAAGGLSNDLGDFGVGGLNVDGFIKVNQFGLLIPKEAKKPVENAEVVIDLSECVRHLAIKASHGDNTKYWRTYDGVMSSDGTPWTQALAEAEAMQPGAKPYESVDIPMTLLEDAGEAEAGDDLGYSLSTTNKKAFSKFLRSVAKSGLDVSTAVVRVKIGVEAMSKGTWNWGVMTFELLGEYTEQ